MTAGMQRRVEDDSGGAEVEALRDMRGALRRAVHVERGAELERVGVIPLSGGSQS